MPKIPLYEQQQLASSIVGTAGVDTSTAQMFNSLAASVQPVQQQLLASLQQEQLIKYQQDKQMAKMAAAQKKVLDDVDTQTALIDWSLQQGQLEAQLKEENRATPDVVSKQYQKQATQQLTEYLNGIANPDVRNNVKLSALKSIRSSADQLTGWELSQRTQNAAANLDLTFGKMALQASNAKTMDDALKLIYAVDGSSQAATLVYGADAENKLQATRSQIAKEYLSSRIASDYAAGKAELETGAFNNYLLGSERNALLEASARRERASMQQEKLDIKVRNIERGFRVAEIDSTIDYDNYDSLDAALKDTGTLIDEIKSLPPEEQDPALLRQAVSRKKELDKAVKGFSADQSAKKKREREAKQDSEAGMQYELLMDRTSREIAEYVDKGGKFYRQVSSKEKLENLDRYQKLLINGFNEGYISEGIYKSETKKIEQRLNQIKSEQKNVAASAMDAYIEFAPFKAFFPRAKEVTDDLDAAETIIKNAGLNYSKKVSEMSAAAEARGKTLSPIDINRLKEAAFISALVEHQNPKKKAK